MNRRNFFKSLAALTLLGKLPKQAVAESTRPLYGIRYWLDTRPHVPLVTLRGVPVYFVGNLDKLDGFDDPVYQRKWD